MPGQDNPFSRFIYELTEPILEPIRKLTGGGMIDFSPIVAYFLLRVLQYGVFYLLQ